ncbi:TIGR03905 family TSCPD domain-containing protein [Clostridium sp. NSJ-49]|uniref:TIGR03905 family TSCPD domain-containing protein n=1 Tax=Clostridium TaxID=1485 RepID=UPI00164B03FB|nr:TIGR03905 family TSCPD domain-containing protein [Clostridium sp. NSJ-49]MBC5626032.1 TIGR03905 family TSCPD domain-containing protein [Clostridium sp. NSJ-49]MDU6341098.1 TIGR03905 family TSCPD domain-containing protein [Clostridium sp.]
MYIYKTSGVCSTEIHIDVKDDKIENVNFVRGCAGNLLGISSLVKGMNINDAIDKLQGIQCGSKGTSCPDQLAKALLSMKNA